MENCVDQQLKEARISRAKDIALNTAEGLAVSSTLLGLSVICPPLGAPIWLCHAALAPMWILNERR